MRPTCLSSKILLRDRAVRHARLSILSALAALPAAAQNQHWVDQLGSSAEDMGYSAAADGSGGSYVAGATFGALAGPNAGNEDIWLARHDAGGQLLWTSQLGTASYDQAKATVADGSGGVFVCGHSGGSLGGPSAGSSDAWLARYDGAGFPIWMRQWGSSDGDLVQAAAPDGSGGVFLAGETYGSFGGPNAGDEDAWLARVDAEGNQLWIRQLGTSKFERALAAASDRSGGVYVGGVTEGALGGTSAGSLDAWLAHYDGAGNQLWVRQLGTSSADWVLAAAPDEAAGFYVAGITEGALGGPIVGAPYFDAWVARYDGNGVQTWLRQLGTADHDWAYAVAPDGWGGVYVGGTSNVLGTTQKDAWLARYDGAGNLQGTHPIATPAEDEVRALVPVQGGRVLASGSTRGDLGGPSAGNWDAWVALYDACSTETYCVGAVNSTGQGASIGHHGSTSIAANDLVLTVGGCPPNQIGIFFLGSFKSQSPFGEGFLCLTGQQSRLPAVHLNGAGNGSYALDFTDVQSPASTITPGSLKHFQFWYRDPQPVGIGFNLSNALSAFFCH